MNKTLTIIALPTCTLSFSHAATLTGTVNTTPGANTNLTTDGTLDWAVFDNTSNTAVANIGATNTKFESPGLISEITAFSTNGATPNNIRGVSNAAQLFSYTDGTSPTSLTNARQGFVINSTLATAGRGVQLSVGGDLSQLYRVDIWTVGFAGQGELRASLNNAPTVILDSQIFGTNGSDKSSNVFSFEFTPDDDLDFLNISFHLKDNNIGASAHVGIQAVTISAVAVPEASTFGLLLGGLTLLFAGSRRQKRA